MRNFKLHTAAFLLLLYCSLTVKAQTFCKTFSGASYSYGQSIIETAEGGYLFAGTIKMSGIPTDLYLVKTDLNGNTTWNKRIGGTGDDEGTSVVQAYNGDYYICGYTYSYGQGEADLYVIRMDPSGNIIWTKTIGGTDGEIGSRIITHPQNGCIIAGYTYSFGAGNNDAYLVRIDSSGNVLWNKTYGGPETEGIENIIHTSTDQYLLAGHTSSFGSGYTDGYLVMVDNTGNLLWSKAIGGTGEDNFRTLVENPDGSFTLAGVTMDFGATQQKLFLVKTDATGNLLTTRKINTSKDMVITGMHTTLDGNLVLSGHVSEGTGSQWAAALIKMDFLYNILWIKKTDESDFAGFQEALPTSDNGYVTIGSLDDATFLSKFDATGNACSGCPGYAFTVSTATGGTAVNATTSVSSGGVSSTGGTVNTAGIEENLCSTLNANLVAEQKNSMVVYPSPSPGTIQVEVPATPASLRVLTLTGQEVFAQSLHQQQVFIDLGHLPEGMYLVQLVSGSKRYSQKLVIKK